ncbi:MAG: 4-hydroxy-3-methylbut-2-enyl diphosphate reductase [Candidatus Cloacimonetes bacterium]|nr:4-hydroxy-3-methylbut-2-enyl diphosphate reductase [Candidatus Cloacimonadota bacterium]
MTNIRLAKNSGFCFGVKRAIKLAEQTANKYGRATTIGPIIHNPQMVESLKKAGVITVEDIDLIETGPVIIRSHGIPTESLSTLKKKKLEIIDATCPYVAKAHEFAKLADKENYQIFILGNPDHPEIIALKSFIESNVYIVDNNDGGPLLPPPLVSLQCEKNNSVIERISNEKFSKIAVICQTTQNISNLQKLSELLMPISNELRIFNTICNATNVRQESSLQLAKKSSLMIVIGGKNSSNTKMLAKLCSEYAPSKHIEVAEELDENWFKNLNYPDTIIGLTAGASTPDWIIIEVYNKIKSIVGDNDFVVNSVENIPGYKEEPDE